MDPGLSGQLVLSISEARVQRDIVSNEVEGLGRRLLRLENGLFLQKTHLSFHTYVGRGDRIQVIRLAREVPIPLSHLVGFLARTCVMSVSMGVHGQV